MLVAGLLMNSADSVCSVEGNIYTNLGQGVLASAALAGTVCLFYKLGQSHKDQLNAHKNIDRVCDVTKCISMDLVEARMNLKKTGLNLSSNLSMPRLELTPDAKLELRQEKRAIQEEVEKYYRHHGYKN